MPRSTISAMGQAGRAVAPGEEDRLRGGRAGGALAIGGHLAVCGALEDGVLRQRHRAEIGHEERRAKPLAERVQACDRGGPLQRGPAARAATAERRAYEKASDLNSPELLQGGEQVVRLMLCYFMHRTTVHHRHGGGSNWPLGLGGPLGLALLTSQSASRLRLCCAPAGKECGRGAISGQAGALRASHGRGHAQQLDALGPAAAQRLGQRQLQRRPTARVGQHMQLICACTRTLEDPPGSYCMFSARHTCAHACQHAMAC